MDYFFLFLISTIFVYPNLPHGLTGWAGAIPGIFVFFFNKVNSVANYAFARRFCLVPHRRYPIT